MVGSGYAAQARLIAHVQQAQHCKLGIFAIALLEDVKHVLHEHKLWL